MRNRWLALPFFILLAFSLASLSRLPGVTWAAADDPAVKSPPAVESTAESTTDSTEPTMSVWMEKKLDYTNGILRGLAMGDLESIRTNAAQLRLLNKVEGFVRNRNPRYRVQLHLFERFTNELVEQAERKNLEGVTLAFNQMTVSCVRCHQTLRDTERNTPAATNEQRHAE
jgi:hypothetical protein